MSYEARTALWKRYQPSFESEILDLIEMSTVQHPTMSKEQMQDAISSRELPRACAENPELLTLSMNILSSFLARSCGSSQATKLLSVFGELCIKECNHGTRMLRIPPTVCSGIRTEVARPVTYLLCQNFLLKENH